MMGVLSPGVPAIWGVWLHSETMGKSALLVTKMAGIFMADDCSAVFENNVVPTSARTSSNARPEIKSLTSLRGIAAIVVVLYHFRDQFPLIGEISVYTSIVDYGWIMVDFFFVLSGFVLMIAYSKRFEHGITRRDYVDFMRNRFARIYPLHLLILCCFFALECGKYVYNPGNLDPPFSKNYPSSIVTNLLLVQAWGFDSDQTWNWASWSISAEFAAYICLPFLVVATRDSLRYFNVALMVAAVAALLAIKRFIGHGSIDLTWNFGVLRCLPSFILGVVAFNALSYYDRKITSYIGSDLSFYSSMAMCLLLLSSKADEIFVILSFMAVISCASLNTSSYGSKVLGSPPLHFLGIISYSVYMTHSLILRLWRLIISKIAHTSTSGVLALMSIASLVAITITVSWLTLKYIENPGRRVLKAH